MSVVRHTPGPWVAGWNGGITGPKTANVIEWRDFYPIVTRISWMQMGRGSNEPVAFVCTKDPEHEANARLIAAAPDMYEALKTARQALYDHGTERFIAPAVEQIDAAIAKATGGAV